MIYVNDWAKEGGGLESRLSAWQRNLSRQWEGALSRRHRHRCLPWKQTSREERQVGAWQSHQTKSSLCGERRRRNRWYSRQIVAGAVLESAEGNPVPAEILCAKYVSLSFAQETGIWLQETGKSKSSTAVTIKDDRKALLFLFLRVNFFLKMLLISLYTEIQCFSTVNFKLETQIRISQTYKHLTFHACRAYPCNFRCSFFRNSLKSRRWGRKRGGGGEKGQQKHPNVKTLKPKSSRDQQHHSQFSSR